MIYEVNPELAKQFAYTGPLSVTLDVVEVLRMISETTKQHPEENSSQHGERAIVRLAYKYYQPKKEKGVKLEEKTQHFSFSPVIDELRFIRKLIIGGLGFFLVWFLFSVFGHAQLGVDLITFYDSTGPKLGGCFICKLKEGANVAITKTGSNWVISAGAGGSTSFDAVTTGVNTTETLTLGTGGTLTFSGSGIVNASSYKGNSTPTATQFSYVDLTSSAQTQLNAKQPTLSTSGAVANQFLTAFTAPDTFSRAQPDFSNLSGTVGDAQIADGTVDGGTGGEIADGTITAADLATNQNIATLGITIDGGGSAITAGVKGFLRVPFACTISDWYLLADQSGSIVIDVWKDTYANFPPTVADTIAGTEKPTLASVQGNRDTALSSWTTTVTADDILGFNVDSATTVTRVNLTVKCVRT